MSKGPGLIPRPVAVGIACVITLVWAANVGATILVPSYEGNDTVNTAFMLLAGLVFALGKGKHDEEDDPDDDPPPLPPVPPPPDPEPDTPPPPGSISVAEVLERLKAERGGA